MPGSSFGQFFRVTTWGESHGEAIGAVIDGCPSGLSLSERDIQPYLDLRHPNGCNFLSSRKEPDCVQILSGIFEGHTTGTPIQLLIPNKQANSEDYQSLKDIYRPGHADYPYDAKYGIRDYRGGGRSSGRETAARVAAGAVAIKILTMMGIDFQCYTRSIGPVFVPDQSMDFEEINQNPYYMPNAICADEVTDYLQECERAQNSAGGIIECIITGLNAGIGSPVFDKLDAVLAHGIMSIGAVKGFEIGDGFLCTQSTGLENNDSYIGFSHGQMQKASNHSGGILGGISDGSPLIIRAAVKPTPSIGALQKTVDCNGNPIELSINGRHDSVIVPKLVVVVESMAAISLLNLIMEQKTVRIEDYL